MGLQIGRYAKALVPILIAGLTAILGYLEDGALSAAEQQTIGAALVTFLGVLLLPNQPKPPAVDAYRTASGDPGPLPPSQPVPVPPPDPGPETVTMRPTEQDWR